MKTTELIQLLEENATQIQREWSDYRSGPTLDMMAHVGRKEDTHAFLLLKAGKFETKYAPTFPHTLSMLRQIPHLRGASFLTAVPHGECGLHRGQYGVQRTLLGIDIPKDNYFELEGKFIQYIEQKCITFHDYQEHRGRNGSDMPRTALIVDCWSLPSRFSNPLRAIGARLFDKTRFKNGDAQQALRLQMHLESQG